MQHLTAYWKPKSGNIGILPPMYAKEITRITGSSLFAEVAEKRYRVVHGNFQLALDKLLRLEPLLVRRFICHSDHLTDLDQQEIFERQSAKQSLPATGDLLVWPPNQQDSRLEFVNMVPNHPSFIRVIVNRMEQSLSRKVLGELRTNHPTTRLFETPPNLQYVDISLTARCQASRIWESQEYSSFGDPESMEPIVTSQATSADNSDVATKQNPGNARIQAWTSNIVPSANPEIAPEVPVEPVAPTRRRVIDSDSDDDELFHAPSRPIIPIAATIRPTLPRAISEDENLMEDEDQLAPESTVPLFSAFEHESGNLIDVSDEEEISPTEWLSQRIPESGAEQEKEDIASLADFLERPSTGKQAGDHNADSFYQKSFPLKDNPIKKQPSTPNGAEELLQSQDPPPVAREAAPTVPEVPPSSATARPTFDSSGNGSFPPAEQEQWGRDGQRGRNNNCRGGNRGARCQSNDHTNDHFTPRTDQIRIQASARGDRHQRGVRHSISPLAGRASRGRSFRGNSSQPSNGNLVDVRTPNISGPAPAVPPGFESTVPLMPANAIRTPVMPLSFGSVPLTPSNATRAFALPPNLDGTMPPPANLRRNDFGQPRNLGKDATSTIVPPRSYVRSNATSGSSTGRSARFKFSDDGSDFVTTTVPRRDQAALRESSLQEALAAIAGDNKRAQEDDPPRLHSTMCQQARNTGKKGGTKKETEAETKARRQKAIEEAYGICTHATPRDHEKSHPSQRR